MSIYNEEIAKSLSQMILSASGWRKVFTEDQEEHSATPTISATDSWLAYVAGITFARYLQENALSANKKILIARDSRPTGASLVAAVGRGFVDSNIVYDYIGITALPEVLAFIRSSKEYAGFFYVSASHNPVGYNGFKFGLANGAVLGGSASAKMISNYKQLLGDEFSQMQELPMPTVLADSRLKLQASKHYRRFIEETLLSMHLEHQAQLKEAIERFGGLGIVIDFNGSARINSIDESLLASLGIMVQVLGRQLGRFDHAIVPEGDSLQLCMHELERLHAGDERYQLGVVLDCDGDRGNLVIINSEGRAQALDAQTTFSLSVVAVLIHELMRDEQPKHVVVNDATSLRVEKLAALFNATCHWAETGEANVLAKAKYLRDRGKIVPICGEGSNGGTIIYPSTVRDPLTTIVSLVNLLFLQVDKKTALFMLQERLGVPPQPWRLGNLIDHLSAYSTTSVVAPEALIKINSAQHSIKERYLKNFAANWQNYQQHFDADDLATYEVYYHEGIEVERHLDAQSSGGMRIHVLNSQKEVVVALWLRGSKTEPVLRVMVDCGLPEVHQQRERQWLAIHRELVMAADGSL